MDGATALKLESETTTIPLGMYSSYSVLSCRKCAFQENWVMGEVKGGKLPMFKGQQYGIVAWPHLFVNYILLDDHTHILLLMSNIIKIMTVVIRPDIISLANAQVDLGVLVTSNLFWPHTSQIYAVKLTVLSLQW